MADNGGVELDKRGLPPISRIRIPDGAKITSTKIRWLSGIGYLPKEIAPYLGVRYQQVRNVLTNLPKRAAREDVPPLVVDIISLVGDDYEHMDRHHLDLELAAGRNERLSARRKTNALRRALKGDEGHEALDDENYQEEGDE